jgi:predicted phage terminase large subunit-like protein
MTAFWDDVAALWDRQAREDFPRPYDVQRLTTPGASNPPHLQLIDQSWADLDSGRIRRLIVSLPPQEGKSQRGRAAIAWWLRRHPNDRVVVASFEKETAQRWGRAVRNDAQTYPQLDLQLRADSQAAGRWDLEGSEGGVYCVGVGGAITGRPADLMLIDDPVKGRAQVESQTYRDGQWDWWLNDASTRLGAHSKVVVVMTRWHEDDLAGRLLANEPGEWTVVNIPALAEDDDPIGRQPGEALQSVRGKDRAFYERVRDRNGPYVFGSLYQGRPTPTAGGMFKRDDLQYWTPAVVDGEAAINTRRSWPHRELYRFATIDLAASLRTSADWTVIAVWAHTLDGDLVLLDRIRARVDDTRHADLALPLLRRWQVDWVGVEDSGRSVNLTTGLGAAGINVRPLKADVDKVTRALAATAKVARRQLWLPADAPWLNEWVGEMLAFPNGKHDDQVDTLAYAARQLLAGAISAEFDDDRRYDDEYREDPEPDFLTMPL